MDVNNKGYPHKLVLSDARSWIYKTK